MCGIERENGASVFGRRGMVVKFCGGVCLAAVCVWWPCDRGVGRGGGGGPQSGLSFRLGQ